MNITNVLLIVLYGVLVPFVAGQLWTCKFEEYKNTIAFPMVCGFITMFAVFEVLAMPMILLQKPFHVLYMTWLISIWMITIMSFILNFKDIVKTFQSSVERLRTVTVKEFIVWTTAVCLVLFQTWLLAGNMHTDTDDARFVAEAMEAYELDTMLQYHPITGEFLGAPIGEMNKDIQAPFPFVYALLGKLFLMIPTIVAHVVMPMLLIPLAYIVYYLIGKYLLKGSRLYTALFLCLLSLIHLFSFESFYAAGYSLLAIIWQGRSVLAMIILPLTWYLLMRLTDSENKKESIWYYLLLCCTLIVACMTSTMSALFVPILTAAYMVINVVKRRKLTPFLLVIPLWIPSIVSILLYKVI